jgi:hypothetical protein
LGIAQFMPETAVEKGLDDPFDPLKAIPASARLLRELRQQFGNLGFVAAAYNAGPRRVSQWLERHRKLPRETVGYVAHVTGRSVDQWRKTPPDDEALKFVHRLPCRDLPAFAELEQEQQAQAERAQPDKAQSDLAQSDLAQPGSAQSGSAQSDLAQSQAKPSPRAHAWQKLARAGHRFHRRVAERKDAPPSKARHEAAHAAAHSAKGSKHQAERNQRPPHEKRKTA